MTKTKETQAQHTPGPWKYEGAKDRRTHARLIWGPEGVAADAVATAEDFNEYSRDSEVDANARLIASAPDMLTALVAAEQALTDILGAADGGRPYSSRELYDNFIKDYNAIRAAISKAEGR